MKAVCGGLNQVENFLTCVRVVQNSITRTIGSVSTRFQRKDSEDDLYDGEGDRLLGHDDDALPAALLREDEIKAILSAERNGREELSLRTSASSSERRRERIESDKYRNNEFKFEDDEEDSEEENPKTTPGDSADTMDQSEETKEESEKI
eukprot:CAMPEP_0114982492 /NCGR_PEP_ID=MMETSP0216-20121206/6149_1 /TAXON_ID=223996 /ORGANISM="Protocruzia adherens, Strain Boccale" /LENGTH=149 /DNA_ID=CAMNT_0002344319 /DNA_START=30 /DNA_END=479 /DNA_ORIENTATION=-